MGKGNEIVATANNVSLISAGTEIRGDIDCAGDLRIDGAVIGTLSVRGKVVIGEAGRVEGDLQCKNSDVAGFFNGTMKVGELLTLKSSAKLYGEVATQRLGIEPGAIFTGTCQMGTSDTTTTES